MRTHNIVNIFLNYTILFILHCEIYCITKVFPQKAFYNIKLQIDTEVYARFLQNIKETIYFIYVIIKSRSKSLRPKNSSHIVSKSDTICQKVSSQKVSGHKVSHHKCSKNGSWENNFVLLQKNN